MSAAQDDERAYGEHVGEFAELHAVGALDTLERMRVEAHAAACGPCAQALGRAAATVAALDRAFVPDLGPPERLAARIAASARTFAAPAAGRAALPAWLLTRRFAAAAAALLLAIGGGAGAFVAHVGEERQAADDGAVLATIASAHFNHVTFTPRAANVPVAKVLYARDGTWVYVVIAGTTCDCDVVAHAANHALVLGRPANRGGSATLFARGLHRPASIDLVDSAGTTLASAALVYPQR